MSRALTRNQQNLNTQSGTPFNPDYYPSFNAGKMNREDNISGFIAAGETYDVAAGVDLIVGRHIVLSGGAACVFQLPPTHESDGAHFHLWVLSVPTSMVIRTNSTFDTDKLMIHGVTGVDATPVTVTTFTQAENTMTITKTGSNIAGTHLYFYCDQTNWYVSGIANGVVTST